MTKKLLIIDDSSTQLGILQSLFKSENWEVHCVQSAKIGLEMIYDFAPDLIITDALMPQLGGFQLIKLIREDSTISKIPVIVYSVLGETNAKFYMKEEYNEYFLSKGDNHDELVKLAHELIVRYPLDSDYKAEILKASLERHKNIETPIENVEPEQKQEENQEEIIEQTPQENDNEVVEEKIQIDFDALRNQIVNLNYTNSDDRLLAQLFNFLNKDLGYDLGLVQIYSFDEEKEKLYFDIRKIILSPILRNVFLNKYKTQNNVVFKQYAPNMETIVKQEDFLSKEEFEITYKDEIIAQVAFYSRIESKWSEDEINILKDILYGFFKKRNIQRLTHDAKGEKLSSTYQGANNQFEDIKHTPNAFFAIVQIVNYADLISVLSEQDLDILNSKISEKIIACTEQNEQVYRNDEDEYDVVFFARDEKHARHRLEYISKAIEEMEYNEYKVQVCIVGANCTINNSVNIIEAQKNARKTLEQTNYLEKVVIYNE